MSILHTSIILENVANDDKKFFFLHYVSKMLFYKFYSTQKNVSVIFASKLMNFTDFCDNFYDKFVWLYNFTLNLVKKNDVP